MTMGEVDLKLLSWNNEWLWSSTYSTPLLPTHFEKQEILGWEQHQKFEGI